MSYSANYTDETGNIREVTLTEEDSLEALKNDYQEILRTYNPRYVAIRRLPAQPGEALHLQVTVKAPSHYLTSLQDTEPKACDSMAVELICYPGYPLKAISAAYAKDHYLASPNVFRSGDACIDEWIPLTSSLTTVVDKLARDMIHDPSVTRYDSVANHYVTQWHQDAVAAGRFPTIPPKLLYAPERTSLPPRRTAGRPGAAPPPLPRRRHGSPLGG